MVAVSEGKEDCVVAMLNWLARHNKFDLVRAVNCVDTTGYSVLALARKRGYDSIGAALVHSGADVASQARRNAAAAKAVSRWSNFVRRRVAKRKRLEAARLMLSNISVMERNNVSFNETTRALERQKSGGLERQKSGGIRKQKSIGRTRTMDKTLLARAISAASKDISQAVSATSLPSYQ